MCVYVYVCICLHIYVHKYVHEYVWMCVCEYTYARVCVCVYMSWDFLNRVRNSTLTDTWPIAYSKPWRVMCKRQEGKERQRERNSSYTSVQQTLRSTLATMYLWLRSCDNTGPFHSTVLSNFTKTTFEYTSALPHFGYTLVQEPSSETYTVIFDPSSDDPKVGPRDKWCTNRNPFQYTG